MVESDEERSSPEGPGEEVAGGMEVQGGRGKT